MFTVWKIPAAFTIQSSDFQKTRQSIASLFYQYKDYFKEDSKRVNEIDSRWEPLLLDPGDRLTVCGEGFWPRAIGERMKQEKPGSDSANTILRECNIKSFDTKDEAVSFYKQHAQKINAEVSI